MVFDPCLKSAEAGHVPVLRVMFPNSLKRSVVRSGVHCWRSAGWYESAR